MSPAIILAKVFGFDQEGVSGRARRHNLLLTCRQ